MPEVIDPVSLTSINFHLGNASAGLFVAKNEVFLMLLKQGTSVSNLMMTAIHATTREALTTGVTCTRSIDGSTFAPLDTAPVHVAGGTWSYGLSATESGGSVLVLKFEHDNMVPYTVAFMFSAKVISDLNDFDPASDVVAHVTLVDTTTTNTDMRGTDNAALASSLATTDGKIDDILEDTAITIPTTLSGLSTFNAASDVVAHVTLVDTTTTNTDMRGTDNAALASSLATTDGKIDDILEDTATTIPTTLSGLSTFNAASDVVAHVTLVDTTTTNTDMRGTDNAALASSLATTDGKIDDILEDTATTIPTTLSELSTFDAASDVVAHVTLVDTTTTNTDMRGTDDAALASSLATTDGKIDDILEDTATTIPTTLSGLSTFDAASDVVVLASDGLDNISAAAPAGVASTLAEMIVQSWRYNFMKTDFTGTEIRTYADDGTTVLTAQGVSEDGLSQIRGAAS